MSLESWTKILVVSILLISSVSVFAESSPTDVTLRVETAEALGNIGDPKAIPYLRTALYDTERKPCESLQGRH